MRAAEKLIAQGGIENLSIREIVAVAGQKNESALAGLLSARVSPETKALKNRF